MAVDSFSHSSSDVLNDIDPLSRALLDLSVQRGMEDAEIASVLGTDAESVLEVRVGLLRSLADKVAPEHADAGVDELQAVIAERLYSDRAEATPAPALDDRADEAEHEELAADDEPDERPTAARTMPAVPADPRLTAAKPRKRRSPLVYLIPLLLLAVIAAGVVALTSGGSDGNDDPGAPAAEQPPAPAPAPGEPAAPADAEPAKPRGTRLEAIGNTTARGTARVEGDRLTLRLRGLPGAQGGAYEVWLYDSVIDAKSLASSKDARVDLNAKLPANADDYESVDVSLEPADGNPNHSGQSVLRVPLDKLR